MTRLPLDSTSPEQLTRLFLEEVGRASLSFASRRSELLAAVTLTSDRGMLEEAARAAAYSAAQLTVTEAQATFWLEPVIPTCWQRILMFFGMKRPGPWRLTGPQSGVRFDVVIAASPGGPLQLTAELSRASSVAGIATERLLATGASGS